MAGPLDNDAVVEIWGLTDHPPSLVSGYVIEQFQSFEREMPGEADCTSIPPSTLLTIGNCLMGLWSKECALEILCSGPTSQFAARSCISRYTLYGVDNPDSDKIIPRLWSSQTLVRSMDTEYHVPSKSLVRTVE